jgi:UDP-3-O-[3-hydroxymyristoyl] glucosamine N-acyltransferase
MLGVKVSVGVKVGVGVSVAVGVGLGELVAVGIGVELGVGVGVASNGTGALQAARSNAARPIAAQSQTTGPDGYRPRLRLGRLTARVYAVGQAGAMCLLGRL